ncbi:hypothetical protein E2562_039432 [Oryza meyeriana var. granulata]|uniref:Uncharacterized protein n=1 Tax=Oryza meyeriana var. granulata TaxID=110450 RepID=A0A6G1EUG8_9ORYZ|nr:hypothetical protein E2562_039432 [Oryza meyeriana var. granulata]
MGVLKGYVCNRSHREGSIVSGIATKEVIEFCIDYMDLKPIGVPLSRHEGRLQVDVDLVEEEQDDRDVTYIRCDHDEGVLIPANRRTRWSSAAALARRTPSLGERRHPANRMPSPVECRRLRVNHRTPLLVGNERRQAAYQLPIVAAAREGLYEERCWPTPLLPSPSPVPDAPGEPPPWCAANEELLHIHPRSRYRR